MTGQIPYSQEAEEAVIGACLVNPDAFLNVAAFLNPDDFYILRHAYIWEALLRIEARHEPIDYLTLQEDLKQVGHLNEIGGPSYLTQLISSMPTSMHAEIYGRLVERAAIRRRLLAVADEIRGLALDEELPIENVTEESEARLFRVTASRDWEHPSDIFTLALAYEVKAQGMLNAEKALAMPTGLKGLDKIITGWKLGEISMIVGPPGGGKTSALDTFVVNALEGGAHVVFFAFEMDEDDITVRMVSMLSGIPSDILKTGPLGHAHITKILEATNRLATMHLHIIGELDTPTPLFIRRRLRRIMKDEPVDLVVCDGLYGMKTHRKLHNPDNRNQEIEAIMEDMRVMAKKTERPILMSHQLNRDAGKGKKKRPTLDKMFGSSSVEIKAQLIVALYRESYYDPSVVFDQTEFIVLKNRDGRYGTARMNFDKSTGRYHDPQRLPKTVTNWANNVPGAVWPGKPGTGPQ